MTSKERNTAFAEVMAKVLTGMSQREVRRRTGISATYVGDMLWGIVPSYQILLRMVEGLEWAPEQTREVFTAAGYAPPVSDEPAADASTEAALDALDAGFRALAEKYDIEVPELYQHEGESTMTPELAAFWIERMEAFILRSLAKEAKELGGEQASVPNNP